MMMSIVQAVTITLYSNGDGGVDNKGLCLSLSLSAAQEMLSASISQTRILQTCGVPHPNMVSGANALQGKDQTHTHTLACSFPLLACS